MPRAIWKGAISFGLVHIPVALVSATSSHNIDFDWLDRRSMDPVGYQRINKATGKPVNKEDIVKGVKYETGHYVVISDEEIRGALPELTQTIDIFAFINAADIPLTYYDTPYYLAPERRGEKAYALLRETLSDTGRVALAQVVIRTKQHLAALMPTDDALTLMLLRWPSEIRGLETLELNSAVRSRPGQREKQMARALVDEMTSEWEPETYHDTFVERIQALIEQKARAGELESVAEAETEPRRSADIIDIAELLKRSLGGGAKAKQQASARQQPRSEKPKTAAAEEKEEHPAPRQRRRTTGAASASKTSRKGKTAAKGRTKSSRGNDDKGDEKRARHG